MAGLAPDYFLRTTRLGFGLWAQEDLPLAMAIWGDPQVTRFVGGPFAATQVKEKLEREIRNMDQYGVEYWPMFLLASGEHTGCAGLRPTRAIREIPDSRGRPAKEFEMGFYLRPSYWGMGLAEEAGRAVIEHAFEVLGAGSLYAAHHPQNMASGRVLSKLGFRFTHEEIYPPTGAMHRAYRLVKA
jgi:[ribosomal protein S5]-alanine N-acetyltransferase